MRFLEKLDLSHARNVYVVGDIHGMFAMLEDKLTSLDFDPEVDHLLSVGDLIDRGPESHRAIEFAVKPWFHFVRGNHEDLAQVNYDGDESVHVQNGGKWFKELSREEQRRHVDILNDAPILLEVTVPSGRRIGIVHASIPTNDWADNYLVGDHNRDQWARWCMWDRTRLQEMYEIKNIDHLFMGHTPLKAIRRMGNCSWIDTAACRGGELSVVKIL